MPDQDLVKMHGLDKLHGLCIAEITYEKIDDPASDWETMTFKFTDGSGLTVRSLDYAEYKSWLVIERHA